MNARVYTRLKIELEMFTEEYDSATILYKSAELASKAKDLGFFIAEAEMKQTPEEERYEHYQEAKDEDLSIEIEDE